MGLIQSISLAEVRRDEAGEVPKHERIQPPLLGGGYGAHGKCEEGWEWLHRPPAASRQGIRTSVLPQQELSPVDNLNKLESRCL